LGRILGLTREKNVTVTGYRSCNCHPASQPSLSIFLKKKKMTLRITDHYKFTMVVRLVLVRGLSTYSRSNMGYLKGKFIYDMVSDTATKPTDQMFEIMKQATREDDVYHVSYHGYA
jgi:hypothetical protein